jgi:hypothetical protein
MNRSLRVLAFSKTAMGSVLFMLLIAMALGLSSCGGGSVSGGTNNGGGGGQPPPPPNAIPETFFGFTINKNCSVVNVKPNGDSCNNPETNSFPGLPFTLARSVGAGGIKWNDLVQCDPTGTVCPIQGSGCSKDGLGANGGPCPTAELVANCQPNLSAPDDPANCAYMWNEFDFWTKIYNAHGVDWMYTLFETPDYLSTRGSRCVAAGQADFGPDATCIGTADPCQDKPDFMWGCDPPFDIDAVPGSGLADGTNQNFKWFVTAMLTHMQANSESFQYWEVWNEPNIVSEWNHPPVSGDVELGGKNTVQDNPPAITCTNPNSNGGTPPNTATYAELIRFAEDSRSMILPVFPRAQFAAPSVTNPVKSAHYLAQFLAAGGTQFDTLGLHGYYDQGVCCPTNCPTPEYFAASWSAFENVVQTAGLSSKPVLDTEFSWGVFSDITNPDMRAAQSARIYLLHESYYPTMARVVWFGEDFPVDLTPNPYNNNNPVGGTGEFWASAATNVADGCTAPDNIQGGFDCPAGLAVKQVEKWTVGAAFTSACACSASPNGGSCSTTPATGIWQCPITKGGGYSGLIVWDNTWTTFPCANAPCGSTTFTIPPAYTSDWQALSGTVTQLNGATSVLIGAKPILIETQ